jgi:thiamine kinase-like enzyme
MAPQTLSDQIARLPCWSSGIEISPLLGGMTNRNFLVTDRQAQRFVVRVGHDLPEHGVMRFNELAAARAAHAAGISPEVIHAAEGMLVCRYVDGRTFMPEDVRDPRHFDRIVELVTRCHREIPRHLRGPALIFWVFQVVRNYLALLGEPGKNRLDLDLAELGRRNVELEKRVGPVEIVFGHNDLLAANIIDDGARLWLIDWDYAGFNSPLFDLANLSSNNAFTPDMDRWLLGAYFGGGVDVNCRRGFAAMKCASLLRELLWGATSLVTSSIDFDYASYAGDYLVRFERMWSELHE